MVRNLTAAARGAIAVATCAAMACGGLAGCAATQAAAPDEGDATQMAAQDQELDPNAVPPRTNDNGLVYGTVDQAEEPGAEVDLVAVEATSGRTGYVYFDELQEVENSWITEDPDATDAHREELEAQSNQALADQLTRLLPDATVTPEQAAKYLDAAVRTSILEPFDKGLEAARQQGLDELAAATGLPAADIQAVLDDALYEAQMQVSRYLPVYESDGKTQIGEFAVGSLT